MIRFDEEPKVVGWIKVHHFWQDTNSNDPSLFRSRKSLELEKRVGIEFEWKEVY